MVLFSFLFCEKWFPGKEGSLERRGKVALESCDGCERFCGALRNGTSRFGMPEERKPRNLFVGVIPTHSLLSPGKCSIQFKAFLG